MLSVYGILGEPRIHETGKIKLVTVAFHKWEDTDAIRITTCVLCEAKVGSRSFEAQGNA